MSDSSDEIVVAILERIERNLDAVIDDIQAVKRLLTSLECRVTELCVEAANARGQFNVYRQKRIGHPRNVAPIRRLKACLPLTGFQPPSLLGHTFFRGAG